MRAASMRTFRCAPWARRKGITAWCSACVITSPPPAGSALPGSCSWPCCRTTVWPAMVRTTDRVRSTRSPTAASAAPPSAEPSWWSWFPGTSVTRTRSDSRASASIACGFARAPALTSAATGRRGRGSASTASLAKKRRRPLSGGVIAVRSKMSPSRTSSAPSCAICSHSDASARPCRSSRKSRASSFSSRCRSLIT